MKVENPLDNYKTLKDLISIKNDGPYLTCELGKLSYAELNKIAVSFSNEINKTDAHANEVIALCFDSKYLQIISTWGVIFSERPFFPININSTKERLSMATEGIRYIITDNVDLLKILEGKNNYKRTLLYKINDLEISLIQYQITNISPFMAKALYLMQTSGSTGLPKIVAHSISSAYIFSSWASDYLKINNEDKLISISPLFFDMSILDVFSTAISGAELYIPDQNKFYFASNFLQILKERNITVMYLTPSLLMKLLAIENLDGHKITKIILAGENFDDNFLKIIKTRMPTCKIYNFYGPTETNVCSYSELTHLETVVIGFPCPYSSIKLSAKSEILVRGSTNALFYIGQDIKDDILNLDGQEFYKTGDLATLTNLGYKYLGRKDHQIKLSGYRVSCFEIERAVQNVFPDELLKVVYHNEKIYIVFLNDDSSENVIEKLKRVKKNLPSHYLIENIFMIKDQDRELMSDTFKTSSKKLLELLLRDYLL